MVVGQSGNIYEIDEKDFLKIIQERAGSIDWNEKKIEWQKKTKEDVETYRPKNSVSGIPSATESEIYNVDLTYELSYDITDIYGNIIFPEGYTINPLEEMKKQGICYTKKLVIINGLKEDEIKWFENEFNDDYNAVLLITDGYALKLNERLKRPVYYVTDVIKKRFVIEKTPSIVFQKKDSLYMTVQTIVVSTKDRNQNVQAE
jgi:conjugal transfer pilus assembly protein TraW